MHFLHILPQCTILTATALGWERPTLKKILDSWQLFFHSSWEMQDEFWFKMFLKMQMAGLTTVPTPRSHPSYSHLASTSCPWCGTRATAGWQNRPGWRWRLWCRPSCCWSESCGQTGYSAWTTCSPSLTTAARRHCCYSAGKSQPALAGPLIAGMTFAAFN